MKVFLTYRGTFLPVLVDATQYADRLGQPAGIYNGEEVYSLELEKRLPGMMHWAVAYRRGHMSNDFMNMYPFLIHKIKFEASKGWARCSHT